MKITEKNRYLVIPVRRNAVETEGGVVRVKNLIGDTVEMPFEGELEIITDNIGYEVFSGDRYYASYQAISDYDKNFIELGGGAVIEKLEWGAYPALK